MFAMLYPNFFHKSVEPGLAKKKMKKKYIDIQFNIVNEKTLQLLLFNSLQLFE